MQPKLTKRQEKNNQEPTLHKEFEDRRKNDGDEKIKKV